MSRLPYILELVNEVGERGLAEIEIETVRARPVPPRLLADIARTRPPTPRELVVLRLVADGRRQPEIAAELHVSTETVKRHLTHLRQKLQAHTQAQVVARAIQVGYLRV
jgi:DNA-binding NarL/FixJ family response regulator